MTRRRIALLALLWLTHHALATTIRGPPKILGRDFKPLQVVRVGQEFRVSCPVEGEPSPIIDWYKDGEPITTAWSRFRISSKALRIRPVLAKDSGIYECKGVNGFGSQIARTRLVVADDMTAYSDNGDPQYPNGWMSQRTADSFHVEKRTGPAFTQETLGQVGPLQLSSGNSIRFMCETQNTPGYPTSKVNWLKDGKSVNDEMWRWSTWPLVLTKLTSEDSGTYTCSATNSFGKSEFSIQLEITEMVERRKPVFVLGYPTNATVLSGKEGFLECAIRPGVTSIPPHIKWLKRVSPNELTNSPRLLPFENQHVLVIQDNEDEGIHVNETQVNGTFVSRLIFKRPELGVHDGVYVCLATNSVGFTFKDARLTILVGAQIVENSSVIPFPLIVFGMSTALSILVIGSACFLRRYQKAQSKQAKAISVRQLSTPSMGSGASSSLQQHSSKGIIEHKRLLVAPPIHHASTGTMMCPGNLRVSEPAIEIALSRCSYCDDQFSDISAVRTYEHCYNGSYVSSTSHSLHCGHYT